MRTSQPCLPTERLLLRPFSEEDVAALVRVAGQRAIADTTISVPHPCTAEYARAWIRAHADAFRRGEAAHFAVWEKAAPRLVGYAGLRDLDHEHAKGELSFWVDPGLWGRGYATEAAGVVLDWGFRELGLNRVCAHHMVRNPASGRVLARLGFRREASMRQHVRKWGVFEDVLLWAVLREDRLPGEGGPVRTS